MNCRVVSKTKVLDLETGTVVADCSEWVDSEFSTKQNKRNQQRMAERICWFLNNHDKIIELLETEMGNGLIGG